MCNNGGKLRGFVLSCVACQWLKVHVSNCSSRANGCLNYDKLALGCISTEELYALDLFLLNYQ